MSLYTPFERPGTKPRKFFSALRRETRLGVTVNAIDRSRGKRNLAIFIYKDV